MRSVWKYLREGYIRFVEKQGFPIIITLCVAVITATALWTNRHHTEYITPPPQVTADVSAAHLMQQSLREAVTPTPMPTEAPRRFTPPLENITFLREFNANTMVQSKITGLWAIHDAVDLKANPGEKVLAISDGVVLHSGKNELLGTWLLIDHGDSIEVLYAGMALNNDYRTGDEVRAGAVIGFCGSGPMDESDLGPHLHLRVTKDGHAIDPASLWTAGN